MTDFLKLWEYIDPLMPFTPDEKRLFESNFSIKEFGEQEILVDLGEVATETYFILSGLIRYYYLTEDGKEITGFIFQEGLFATSSGSFFAQAPSTQIVETIEPCRVLALPFDGLQELFRTLPKTEALIRQILIQRFNYSQQVIASLIIQKPEQRYSSLLDSQPELAQRVPQKVLASYLGITPVSLSRIRNRIREKGN
jgi:CRP-like cAMP-binding protein